MPEFAGVEVGPHLSVLLEAAGRRFWRFSVVGDPWTGRALRRDDELVYANLAREAVCWVMHSSRNHLVLRPAISELWDLGLACKQSQELRFREPRQGLLDLLESWLVMLLRLDPKLKRVQSERFQRINGYRLHNYGVSVEEWTRIRQIRWVRLKESKGLSCQGGIFGSVKPAEPGCWQPAEYRVEVPDLGSFTVCDLCYRAVFHPVDGMEGVRENLQLLAA